MESLPPLVFAIGIFNGSSNVRRSGRERRQESSKRLRSDDSYKPIEYLCFKNCISVPELFPSLLSTVEDIPVYIKIILATEGKRLVDRQKYIQQTTMQNIRLNQFIASAPKLNIAVPSQEKHGLLDQHIIEVVRWVGLEQKVRTQMRRIVQHWLYRRYKSRTLNDTDPCTLEPIQTPVCVFDVSARGYYQFDAKSLRRTIDFGLGFQDWMFPEPKFPKNPLTNLDFGYGQMLKIQVGIRQAGLGSWLMEGFAKSNWNEDLFRLNYSVPLKLHAVQSLYKNPQTEQMQEFLIEFIEDQWDAHEMSRSSIKTILRWAVKHELEDPYMQKWLDAWYDYFKLKIQYGLRDSSSDRLNTVFAKTLLLLENSAKIAEFAERRLASIRAGSCRTSLPPIAPSIISTSSITTFITNPMFGNLSPIAPQPSVILNPEDDSNSIQPVEEDQEESLVFSSPQEIASFLEFLSQLLPDGTENTEAEQ